MGRYRYTPNDVERNLRAIDRTFGRVVDKIVTTNYTADDEDDLFVVQTGGGGFTLTLPAVTEALRGKLFTVIKTDASVNNLTIQPAAGQTIDGAGSVVFNTQYAPKRYRAVRLSTAPTYGYLSA